MRPVTHDCAAGILSFLIKCPPVVKKASIGIAFFRQIRTISEFAACFPLDPPLAVAVLGKLDVLPGMEQCITVKTVVDIAGMRDIAPCDDAHERVILPDAHFSPIRGAGPPGGALRPRINQQCFDLLV